jgi:sec-independent protein translocase protein TatA
MLGDLLSPMHLLLILVIALLVFGPSKLPQLAANLGKSLKEFKKSMNAVEEDLSAQTPAQQPAAQTQTPAVEQKPEAVKPEAQAQAAAAKPEEKKVG